MKRTIQTLFLATVCAAAIFSGCKKSDSTTTTTSAAPSLTVNDGVTAQNKPASVDTISIKVLASADTDRKIKKMTITRAVSGGATNKLKDSTLSVKDLIYTHYDLLKLNGVPIQDQDIITYTVSITDDNGVVTTKSFTVSIQTVATSPQILLGADNNTTNDYHFFGVANNFKTYRAGATGADLARNNSSNIDIVYHYDPAGSVGNAIYSPDYAWGGAGWATEATSWTTKNSTIFKISTLSTSSFTNLTAAQFLTELSNLDLSTGTTNKIPNLSVGQVVGYKRMSDGKRGFVAIVGTANSATGVLTIAVKSEL